MKLRHSMSWLHTWSGLVFGWVLYLMFVTGSLGYFDEEITRWMQPEIPIQEGSFDTPALLQKAEQRLQQVAPKADEIYIELPLARHPFFSLWWHNPEGPDAGWHNEKLDPNNGNPVTVRDTGGGEFLYRLHYRLHYMPVTLAHWITSFAALFMLVASITGIIIHRRFFKDFFTLRRGKKLRFWRDTHNIFGVLPLPFHLMITYSGLMLLMFTTMLPIPIANVGTGPELRGLYDKIFKEAPLREASGLPAINTSLLPVYQHAISSRNGKNAIGYLSVQNPGDQNSIIEVAITAERGIHLFDHFFMTASAGI
jgi:uncharacterized iron-regulated membrane protein